MTKAAARGGRREKSTPGTPGSQQVDKSKGRQGEQSRQPKSESRQTQAASLEPQDSSLTTHASPLDAAAIVDIIEELRVIENTIATLPGLVEHARVIGNALGCDEPSRRDAIAQLDLRLTGHDVDRVEGTAWASVDDDLLDGMVDAVNAVVEAATWRLQRLCRVLFRVSEKAAPGR